MTYIYQFWETFKNPSSLTYLLEKEEEHGTLQGYKKTVFFVLALSIFLFVLKDFYGMNTQRLTELIGQGLMDRYIFARYISLVGAILFGVMYFLLHYFVVAYFISVITDVPFKRVQKVQIYVLPILLFFNFLEFIIFTTIQFVPLFSPFSVAAIVAQYTANLWILFFFNQIACSTVISVLIHYTFLEQWIDGSRKILLMKLIGVQLLLAASVATFSTSPFMDWLGKGF